jgi:hypothetical protein
MKRLTNVPGRQRSFSLWRHLGDQKGFEVAFFLDTCLLYFYYFRLKVGGNGWVVAIVIILLAILVVLIIYVTGYRIVLESEK